MTGARFRVGSWQRVLHAVGLGLLQPVVPVVSLVLLRPLLFVGDAALPSPTALGLLAVAGAGTLVLAILLGLGLMKAGRVGLSELGLRPDGLGRELLLGVLGGIACVAALFVLVAAFGGDADDLGRTIVRFSPAQRALFAVLGAQIAMFEECVFRGYLQPSLVARLGLWAGVGVTALLYAAWHPPHFGLVSFLVRFATGLVLGALRGRDRPLTAPLVAHATFWATMGLA